jgi:photosystem I P700 chlorophyll a apoprotein A2
MVTKFPTFSNALIRDPTTRRLWFGIATAHDFENHDGITEERLYQKIFASHFGQLAIIFLWTSGNLFHVAWQGNFETWIEDPLHVRPIAHSIWDPHFGQPAVESFTRGGASGPVNIATSGVYQWWYTIGIQTNQDLYQGSIFLSILATRFLFAGWLHLKPEFKPNLSWFKNAESRLNHHLSGLFGVSSLAWSGHLIHVAIPASRGKRVDWSNFLSILPHKQGLRPFFYRKLVDLYTKSGYCRSCFWYRSGIWIGYSYVFGGFSPTNTKSMAYRYCSSSSCNRCIVYYCRAYISYKLRYWS